MTRDGWRSTTFWCPERRPVANPVFQAPALYNVHQYTPRCWRVLFPPRKTIYVKPQTPQSVSIVIAVVIGNERASGGRYWSAGESGGSKRLRPTAHLFICPVHRRLVNRWFPLKYRGIARSTSKSGKKNSTCRQAIQPLAPTQMSADSSVFPGRAAAHPIISGGSYDARWAAHKFFIGEPRSLFLPTVVHATQPAPVFSAVRSRSSFSSGDSSLGNSGH